MAKRNSIEVVDQVTISRPPRPFLVLVGVLFYPAVIWNKIRGQKFTSFENDLITELASRLSSEQSDILKSQVQEINYVNRVNSRRRSEAILYKMRPWGPDRSRKRKFNLNNQIVILATFRLQAERKKLRVDFVCVDGVLSMVEFDRDVREFSHLSEFRVEAADLDPQAIDDFGRAMPQD